MQSVSESIGERTANRPPLAIPVHMPFSARRIRDHARELGFNLVGLTPARPSPHLAAYFRWLEAGRHGEMGYMAREDRVARRCDLNVILPGARSLVMVGLDYHSLNLPDAILADPKRGRIAAYAWGRDYHDLMLSRLEELAAGMCAESRSQVKHRAYVDTGAILERSHAQQAGLGFIGKNTMLIHPRRGSDFFLGEILTDAEFDEYDQPQPETRCGRCARCLSACPTRAFPEPYVLDARRCISYLTIEQRGSIDRALRPLTGNWVFGCDVCQEVCPWQRFAIQTLEPEFFPIDAERAAPPLTRLLSLDEGQFAALFRGSPVERLGRERLVRNACLAAGNSGSLDFVPQLKQLVSDADRLIRSHAAWALAQVAGAEAAPALAARLAEETDATVQEELAAALAEMGER